jgi:hypothetical protein
MHSSNDYDWSFPVVLTFGWSPKLVDVDSLWVPTDSNEDVFPALNVCFNTSATAKSFCVDMEAFRSPDISCLWLSCGSLNAPCAGKSKSILSSCFFVWFSFPMVIWLISSSLASGNTGSFAASALAAATAAARNCLSSGRCVAEAGRGNEGF